MKTFGFIILLQIGAIGGQILYHSCTTLPAGKHDCYVPSKLLKINMMNCNREGFSRVIWSLAEIEDLQGVT